MSDIHFNGKAPTSGAERSYSRIQEDANGDLVVSALSNAHLSHPQALFVLCLGDLIAHEGHYRSEPFNMRRAQAQLAKFFSDYLKETPVALVLGNNDADRHNELQTPEFLAALSGPLRGPLLKNDGFHEFWISNWCFACDAPGLKRIRLLGLNTAYFYAQTKNCTEAQRKEVFRFINSEIERARRDKKLLWLAFHVPPGIDPKELPRQERLWNTNVEKAFLQSVISNRDVVKAIFAGHTHHDEFRIIKSGATATSFIHICPSVSPAFNNNPAYQVFSVREATGELIDCKTYFLPVSTNGSQWCFEYSFTNSFGGTNYSVENLVSAYDRIKEPKSIERERFRKHYSVSNLQANAPVSQEQYFNEVLCIDANGVTE